MTARVLAESVRGYRVAGTARKPSAQSTDGVDMLPLAAAATIYPGVIRIVATQCLGPEGTGHMALDAGRLADRLELRGRPAAVR